MFSTRSWKISNIDDTEKPWICLECMKDNIPFYALTQKSTQKLFELKNMLKQGLKG